MVFILKGEGFQVYLRCAHILDKRAELKAMCPFFFFSNFTDFSSSRPAPEAIVELTTRPERTVCSHPGPLQIMLLTRKAVVLTRE